MLRVDSRFLANGQKCPRILIAADFAKHRNVGAEAGGLHRLICPLAARRLAESGGRDALTLVWEKACGDDVIHIKTAYDQ